MAKRTGREKYKRHYRMRRYTLKEQRNKTLKSYGQNYVVIEKLSIDIRNTGNYLT